jgi:hypothetical protein
MEHADPELEGRHERFLREFGDRIGDPPLMEWAVMQSNCRIISNR